MQHDVLSASLIGLPGAPQSILKKQNRIPEYSKEYEVVFRMLYNQAFKLVKWHCCGDYETHLQDIPGTPETRLCGRNNV